MSLLVGERRANDVWHTLVCRHCDHEFGSLDAAALFCCDACRAAYWRLLKKLEALVQWIVERFNLRAQLDLIKRAVLSAPAVFLRWAVWSGLRYHTKKYTWSLATKGAR